MKKYLCERSRIGTSLGSLDDYLFTLVGKGIYFRNRYVNWSAQIEIYFYLVPVFMIFSLYMVRFQR